MFSKIYIAGKDWRWKEKGTTEDEMVGWYHWLDGRESEWTLGSSVLHYLPEFSQIHVHWVSDTIQPSHPLPPSSPFAFNLSQHQGLFQEVSSYYEMPKYRSFSFNISPSNEYSGLISFRMDCLALLAIQGALKSLLQYHNSKASVLQCLPSLWSNSHICTWLLEKP